jgi:hypothetical protein
MNINTFLLVALIFVILFKSEDKAVDTPVDNSIPYFNHNTQRVMPYRQIGVLYKDDGNVIIPLYGRRTHVRSNTWNYYTVTDTNTPIQIGLSINDRECMNNIGCKELYSEDSLYIPEYNSVFNVKLHV